MTFAVSSSAINFAGVALAPSPALLPLPIPSATAMTAALTYLFKHDEVIELRAIFSKGRKRTDSGYFAAAHRNELVREAARLNKLGAAVYVVMNEVDPQILSRYANRIEEFAQTTTADTNVTRRRWLLLDFDPVRPKDTSASDAQVEAARLVSRRCYAELKSAGWPD